MSIFPKKLIKGQDEFTTFHMKICNNSNENIEGKINYKIFMPNGSVEEMSFKRIEKISARSEFNQYDRYYIKQKSPTGRYHVEGRFLWNGENILSETNETDYFDVEEY